MLYEPVAGRVPFSGPSSSDTIAAILEREPLPLARFDPDVPAEFQRIVTKALRKDREQRYQTAKDLALDLQALSDTLRSAARQSEPELHVVALSARPSDATRPERILFTEPDTSLWQAKFSPNGRWISFVAQNEHDSSRIALVVAPSSGAVPRKDWVPVASDQAWPDKPRWAPDGHTLYFLVRGSSSFFNLWGTRFDAERGVPIGKPFEITHFDAPSLMVSPGIDKTEIGIAAHRAVLTMLSATGSIWMLEDADK